MRRWHNGPDESWESLDGNFPVACLDIHPSNQFISMQVISDYGYTNERAAIWDVKTKNIIWCPDRVNAICWIENGKELLVLETKYDTTANRPNLYATPTESEYQYFVRRLSWPDLDDSSHLQIFIPMGWLIDIVPSPIEKKACIVWQDQCESGIEFISWECGVLKQLAEMGFKTNSNFIQGPVFNIDGSVLAMSFGAGCWWSDAPDEPSRGGTFNIGHIIWREMNSSKYNRINVNVNVPAGWLPDDPMDILRNMYLSSPTFISPNEVKIQLPTKKERIISLY